MARVFLSHSSTDKPFVEPIADLLGKNNCIYDKYTFEIGNQTIEEIFEGMDRSDIFVYFISDRALESEWVKNEINKAETLLSNPNEKLSQIFPIIIDDTISHTDTRIAPFLRNNYNLQRVDNYKLAYRKIKQLLEKKNFDYHEKLPSPQSYFYGRNEEIKAFAAKFDSTTSIKSAIISGISGIGKKHLFIKL